MKKPKLVKVKWIDSAFNAGWYPHATHSTLARCETVGYLTYASRKSINVSMNLSPESRGETMAIPRSCVKSIKRLR
jgi:hypothetical protein